MGMYDYEESINYDSSYDSDGTWFIHSQVGLYEDSINNWDDCCECKQLKKEVKRLQQLVELLQLPNAFE